MNLSPPATGDPLQSLDDLDDYFVVIPALNEGDRIGGVIDKLHHSGFHHIVIVNDGSTDHTSEIIARYPGVFELKHLVNLGPGASTMTGIRFAVEKNARYIATIDADHQSDPGELLDLVKAMHKKPDADLIIGSRFLRENDIPASRRFYNFIGNLISFAITGIYVTDSQSGFKIMTRRFAEQLSIDYNGFEFCIDIIKKARMNRLKIAEIPVSVVYTSDTLSKGQSFREGLMMLGRLFNPFT